MKKLLEILKAILSSTPKYEEWPEGPFICDFEMSQIKQDEGLRLKPYRCTAGKLTIGYGRNLEDVGINEIEAEDLLYQDLRRTESALFERIHWLKDQPLEAQQILLNMAFNMGVDGLLKFKKTLAAIQWGDYQAAAAEMLESKWAKQVGPRAQRLSERMGTIK